MAKTANFKVACLAISFVVLLLLSSAWYWSSVMKPVLKNDMQSLASSMASARANELASILDKGEPQNADVVDALDAMLAYTYERTQKQFFVSVDLELSEDFKLDYALQGRFFEGDKHCKHCFYRDYPLYSPSNYRLIGVLTIGMSNSQADTYIRTVQRLFMTGAAIVLIAAIIILILIWNMTAAMDRLNASLEYEVYQRTRSLEEEVGEHAETQLRLSHARDEMQRIERSRIAKTLHDGVGQVLQALRLGLQRLSVQIDSSNKQLVQDLVEDTGEAIGIIRDFCSELRPLHLESMSLEQALFSHVERLDRRVGGIDISMVETGECQVELSMLVKEQLFLIAAELLNNAVKHSQASSIQLNLEYFPSYVVLVIKDNGIGLTSSHSSEGLGLSLLNERCERIGASLKINSLPHGGLQARCELPLNKNKGQE